MTPSHSTVNLGRQRSSNVFWVCLLISLELWTAVSFNVDIKSPLIFTGPPNSYFGYSVGILENSQGTWLLVGAPRANDSSLAGVKEPGAVFQCNWQYRSSCQPIFIDHIGNDEQQIIPKKWKNITVKHHKDNQWLGASIDINVNGDREIMICAPRWVEKRFSVQGMLLMNGLCYESKKELHFDESSAWPALEYWKKQVHAKGYYTYGMGSLGMAAVYSQNGKFSVLGAPGLNDWSGGFAFIDSQQDTRPRVMEVPIDLHNNSYFGMSIATARLTADEVFTIIGGPKSEPGGKVMAYNRKFQLLFVKEGEQFGSSFGSSVCAVDLDNDGLDDLVVGAPLYTDDMDEGRVYVYMNREFFTLELISPVLSGNNVRGARFGTAVANVGDLNGDGFQDIAIGAPYEEESGVVYIYNGAKTGLYFNPSQRILGRKINSGLKAFGGSFSRPWDVDSNHYKDFVVGAFESNKVVLLRTRSVLDLFATLDVTPELLNPKGQKTCFYKGKPWHCLDTKICLLYKGLNLPPSAEVNITLRLDTLELHRGERSRLFIIEKNGREMESINKLVTVRLGRMSCLERYKVYVRRSRDILTPLRFELDYDIASDSIGIASLCTICPIRNIYNPSLVYKQVHFVSDCGDDNKCQSDLKMQAHAEFNNDKKAFIIDDNPSFDVKIIVSNKEETSYFTLVTLEYPSYVFYASIQLINELSDLNNVICMQSTPAQQQNSSNTIIDCDVLFPLESGSQAAFYVKFYAHGIPYEVHQFDVVAKVSTASKEKSSLLSDNSVTVTIPVYMESNVELVGVSIPSQVAVTPRSESALPPLSLSHFYVLRNFGPSPIPHAQIHLSVPHFYGLQAENINVESAAVTKSHVPMECNIFLPKRVASPDQDSLFPVEHKDQQDSFVSCESTTCARVQCYIGLMHKNEAVYINISMSVQQDVLKSWKVEDQLGFVSTSFIQEPDYSSHYTLRYTHNATIGTLIVYAWHSPSAVPLWILITSVISGLLLLYIIVVVLWKCGFFRRKKREELKMLMKATEAEREILHVDTLSAASSDIMVLPPSDHGMMFTSSNINNNHDSQHGRGGHFNEAHNASTLYRRNYHHDEDFQDLFVPVTNGHSSYTLPRNMRPPVTEHTMPTRMDSFHSMPRPEARYNQHCYLQPVSPQGYHRSDNNNKHNEMTRIPRPPPASDAQAFNNDMYLEPLESRG